MKLVVDNNKPKSYAQGNEVVNARYSMPLACHRLLVLALSKLRYKPGEASSRQVVVTAQDWYSTFDPKSDVIPIRRGANAYRDIAKAAKALQITKAAAIEVPTDKGYELRNWVSKAHYQQSHGCVEVTFSEDIMPHLTNLAAEFTTGELQAVAGFQHKHSYRLYMLLRQFRQTGVRQEPVTELQAKLCVNYPRYAMFKAKVLSPALQDIRQAGIKIKMIEHKKGRSVKRLEFRFNSP